MQSSLQYVTAQPNLLSHGLSAGRRRQHWPGGRRARRSHTRNRFPYMPQFVSWIWISTDIKRTTRYNGYGELEHLNIHCLLVPNYYDFICSLFSFSSALVSSLSLAINFMHYLTESKYFIASHFAFASSDENGGEVERKEIFNLQRLMLCGKPLEMSFQGSRLGMLLCNILQRSWNIRRDLRRSS